jgi:hypothetical protein
MFKQEMKFILSLFLLIHGVSAGGKVLTFSSDNWKYSPYENSYFFLGVNANVGTPGESFFWVNGVLVNFEEN